MGWPIAKTRLGASLNDLTDLNGLDGICRCLQPSYTVTDLGSDPHGALLRNHPDLLG